MQCEQCATIRRYIRNFAVFRLSRFQHAPLECDNRSLLGGGVDFIVGAAEHLAYLVAMRAGYPCVTKIAILREGVNIRPPKRSFEPFVDLIAFVRLVPRVLAYPLKFFSRFLMQPNFTL